MERKPIMGLTDHRRLVNWWIRFEDLNWPSPDNIDRLKRRAEKMAEANITSAVIFGCHFRWDYLPYFTLLHDHIATVAEELHKYNIELFDRHSVNLIHRYDTPEQMRHVMLHSGPHIPFSPSREAAACWEYKGKRLNDWRMVDVKTNDILYFPQYASEGFCYNNPEFIDAYCDYAKRLVADTGIDGLAAEDPVHYMHFLSCGCEHCRRELKERTGIDLPSYEDRGFWGNWENPAWNEWIDMRFESGKRFFEKLMPHLPKDFPVTTCGSDSAAAGMNGKASDARVFLDGGVNYVHCEWSGNTPPYKHDPVTSNSPISRRLVSSSHHMAVAQENGLRCFTTGYGFTEPTANVIWALNKTLDQDCCFSTLKARLGLPQHILDTLPEEYDVVGKSYAFEKDHPELFIAEHIGQLGVYFSYETRNHTLYGNMTKGYYKDYSGALKLLLQNGISPHTIFSIPKDAKQYPLVLLSGVAAMTEDEKAALRSYLAAGGKVVAVGPSSIEGCVNSWSIPTKPDIATADDFFDTIEYGVWHHDAKWVSEMELKATKDPYTWQQPAVGLFYQPHRLDEGNVASEVLDLCRVHCKPLPVQITECDGFAVTTFENNSGIVVQLLAMEYETDIDHHLDEIRFHRSRVNYINKVEPIGVTKTIRGIGQAPAKVYTPFNEAVAEVVDSADGFEVRLPEDTTYVILHFNK